MSDSSNPPEVSDRESGEAPLVSLIIVNFRTPDLLKLSLERIAEAHLTMPYEILVIDNAPLDKEAELICAEHPKVRYLRNERNVGFGRGVNRGLREGHGEFFLVLNPDVEVQSGSVETLLEEMERDPSAGIVAPKLLYPDGTLQHSCRTFYTLPVFLLRRTFLGKIFPNHKKLREHLMLDYDHDTTRRVDWCLGASLLVRKRAVDDVGPMDERYFLYFEDVDWCYRLAARGWKVLYHPAAVMIHHYQRTSARKPGRGLLIHLASTFRYYEKWSFVLYWLKRRTAAIRRLVLVVSDMVAVNLAFLTAYAIRELSSSFLVNPTFGFGRYARFLLFADAVALLSLALMGMYRGRRREEAGEQVLGAVRAILATGLIVMASTFLFFTPLYSRVVIGLFLPLSLVMILLFRWLIFHLQGSMRSRRLHMRRIGLLAPEDEAEELKRRVARYPDFGMELLPLTSRAAVLESHHGEASLAVEDAIALWVNDERIAEVILFETWPACPTDRLIERLEREGIPVRLVPGLWNALSRGTRMGEFFGFPALGISGSSSAARSWEKRLFDSIGAIFSILVLLIPFILLRIIFALLGKSMEVREVVGSSGSVLLVSRLPGNWPGGALFTALREFPTLLLWLRGKWSLVGIVPIEVSRWHDAPEAYRRLPPDAAPGWITLAGETIGHPIDKVCAANREYAGRWSLALDMNLLLGSLKGRKDR